jgi:hypothetical protein
MSGWTARGIAEVIGLVGIVGSLVFVGLEVRQNSVATRASTNAGVADAFRELNLVMASSPELASALVASMGDLEEMSTEEAIMALGLWLALFHTWSNGHRQWTNETLDQVMYDSIISEVSTYGRDTGGQGRSMRWAWEGERFIFNSDFQLFVDELIGVDSDAN